MKILESSSGLLNSLCCSTQRPRLRVTGRDGAMAAGFKRVPGTVGPKKKRKKERKKKKKKEKKSGQFSVLAHLEPGRPH